jgi:equilibrative nucleoside transporter 1/2/3
VTAGDNDFAKYEVLHPVPPQDRFFGAYWIFVLLGVGGMWPWNGFLTAYDYFNSPAMLGDLPSFQFIMSIVFNVATVTFQFLGVAFGEKISLNARVLITFIPFVVSMVLVPYVHLMSSEFGARLGIVLALVFIAGMSTAVGFNCIVGLASQFPPEYVGAVMLGQGVAGVVVGGIRIITKASFGDTDQSVSIATQLYFLLAAGVEVLCIVFYFVLIRTNFARYHMAKATMGQDVSERSADSSRDKESDALLSGAAPKASPRVVLRKVLLQGITVWSVFFVTLSMFPGMTSLIPNTPGDFPPGTWFGIANIFLFQLFDFVGRTLPRWVVIIPPRFLWIFSVARVVFAGLFILCIRPLCGPIFASQYAAFVIMTFFALTNGYFGTLAMMFAPRFVDDHEKNVAGMIMSVFLQLGIFSAVLFALFILYLVSPCSLPTFLAPAGLNCSAALDCAVANATAAFENL